MKRRLLQVFGRLPPWLRRFLVRRGSPLFLVGAACVVEHDGKVLLCRHSYFRGWGLPGGGLDHGEAPAATAIREVHEEVALAVEPTGGPEVVIDARYQRVDLVYRCRLAPGASPDDATPSSAEIDEVRWVDPADLTGIGLSTTAEPALRAVGVLREPVERPGR